LQGDGCRKARSGWLWLRVAARRRLGIAARRRLGIAVCRRLGIAACRRLGIAVAAIMLVRRVRRSGIYRLRGRRVALATTGEQTRHHRHQGRAPL
jgi:hypothetical protein